MAYITRIVHGETISGSRIMALTIVVLGMIAMQSVTVHAQWTTADAQGNINSTNTGKVGIGTSSPWEKLSLPYDSKISIGAPTLYNFSIYKASAGDLNTYFDSRDDVAASYVHFRMRTGGTPVNALTLTGSGNVGIGITAPGIYGEKLTVKNSSGNAVSTAYVTNDWVAGTTGSLFQTTFGAASGNTYTELKAMSAGASAWNNLVLQSGGGNVGIGTTSPSSYIAAGNGLAVGGPGTRNQLTVFGAQTGSDAAFADLNFFNNGVRMNTILSYRIGGDNSSELGFFTTNAGSFGERVRIDKSGNVGIGTSNPETRLSVVGSGTTLPTTYNGGDVATFVAPTDNFTNISLVKGGITNPQGLHFGVNQASLFSEIQAARNGIATNTLVLNRQGGNVGIGLPAPTEKLEVSGNIKVTGTGNITASGAITGGTINAKYQDVAEWVESSQALAAGTVVVLDHTRSNQVIASSQAYDTRVAGVISSQPGITLGENGMGKVLVATTGRVKIKVDATAGPIQIGDLLVTSDKEGVAKKSEPLSLGGVAIHRPGTLIGKALEPLARGTGEILVLLSLQ